MKKLEQTTYKHNTNNKIFTLPQNSIFCYACCGNCIYYGTENYSGFCELHRRNISSSDPACGSYR